MKTDWMIVFIVLAGVSVIAGTLIFLNIYRDTAVVARNIRETIKSVNTITEEQIRETHRRGFDVEAYIRDRNFIMSGAALTVAPFLHDRKAVWGFYLYIASALFGAIAAIMSTIH